MRTTKSPLPFSSALLAVLFLLLLQACGSGKSPIDFSAEPLIDTEKRIHDSIYGVHGDSFELFMNSISDAVNQVDLKEYTMTVSDSMETTWAFRTMNLTDSLPKDSLALTYRNCLLLFNEQNLFSFKKPKNERSFGVDKQLSLMQLTSLLRFEGSPASTHEVEVDTWNRDSLSNDSISKSYREALIKRMLKTAALMREVTYLLIVEDKCMKKPKMISETTFESGFLITDTKLIRLKDAKVLVERTLLVENSNELSHIQQSLNIGMSMVNGSNSILETDLIKRRSAELVDFYDIH